MKLTKENKKENLLFISKESPGGIPIKKIIEER
jgi:hypothetical protein